MIFPVSQMKFREAKCLLKSDIKQYVAEVTFKRKFFYFRPHAYNYDYILVTPLRALENGDISKMYLGLASPNF